MTNEEAIQEIQRWLNGCPFENTKEAFNLAIQALKTGEIYITGEDYNLYMEGYKAGKRDFEPKKGEWYYNYQNGWHCSICHESVKDMPTVMGKANFAFCPNCGAKMKGGAE